MINWVLQTNLTKPNVLEAIKSALTATDESYEEITVIPFSSNPPEVKSKDAINIVYGSSTLMLNAYKNSELRKGLFYDPDKFTMQNYVNQWSDNLLNSDGQLIKLGEICNLSSKPNQKWFIRPSDDEKGFSGKLIEFKELNEWIAKMNQLDSPEINNQRLAWISPPKTIEKEWRLFIVDDKIISSSRYMHNCQLDIDTNDNPMEMLSFAQNRINEYRLDNVYVMDIAEVNDEYKIIECNCFNGTGFYKHQIGQIVSAINDFVRERMRGKTVGGKLL